MDGRAVADSAELAVPRDALALSGPGVMGGHREAAYWRGEAIEARSRAGALAVIHRQNKEKLEEARAECRAVRRRAKGALAAVAEAARLRRLLEQQSVDCRRRSSMVSLRRENGELRREVAALREDNEVLRRALAGTSVDGRLESRIVELERRLCRLKAMRSNDARHRFGDRSERQSRPSSPRRRGQQPGRAGPSRTPRKSLAVRTEIVELAARHTGCERCGRALAGHGWVESELIEIEVAAYRRRIRRRRYRRVCGCAGPATVLAPPVARLFAHTAYGISVWTTVLLEHWEGQRPFRQIARWMTRHGLAISPGTLCDRLGDLSQLFEPLSAAIRAHLVTARVLQGDETSWRVQQRRRDGASGRAWLWVGQSHDAVWFHIDPRRSLQAALKVFEGAEAGAVLLSDRYSSYVALADRLGLAPSFCWAHMRRDFIECEGARDTPWKRRWLERIAAIYRTHRRRQQHFQADRTRQVRAFATANRTLKAQVKALFGAAEAELAEHPEEHPRAEPLRRLLKWRYGLERFVADPEVPIDNNASERSLRAPVIGRKLSFGNDSWTGARLTGHMYSVLGTLKRHEIDLEHWLHDWLSACAEAGRAPPDLTPWLPWSMEPARRQRLQQPRASPVHG